ncbi:hypothetical protein ACFO0N_17070 [Halobium salinum]|uniref:Uncharacterized protein n=1 Tax=Halobium salinum TaxID=1364940 RepID=A0ABD5PFY4_9EURY|nr:hypothetical protein [Halobium salinum]
MDERLRRFVRTTFRNVGRQYEESKRAYREGRGDDASAVPADLPRDEEGRLRLVCRRYAERRAAAVDDEGRPACFEAGHPDCEGCVEDVRDGLVETW